MSRQCGRIISAFGQLCHYQALRVCVCYSIVDVKIQTSTDYIGLGKIHPACLISGMQIPFGLLGLWWCPGGRLVVRYIICASVLMNGTLLILLAFIVKTPYNQASRYLFLRSVHLSFPSMSVKSPPNLSIQEQNRSLQPLPEFTEAFSRLPVRNTIHQALSDNFRRQGFGLPIKTCPYRFGCYSAAQHSDRSIIQVNKLGSTHRTPYLQSLYIVTSCLKY